MLSFDEKEFMAEELRGLALRGKIEEVVDEICREGYSNLFWIGIGGTYAYLSQMHHIIKSHSRILSFAEEAVEFAAAGNKQFDKNSVVIITSVTGDTKEVNEAVRIAREAGARVIGFVGSLDTPLGQSVTYPVACVGALFYKLYYTAFRFMYQAGDFPEYEQFVKEMEKLPQALLKAKEEFDPAAEKYAEAHGMEPLTYLIGAGNLWGYAYCYAMCVLEECQWIRTKAVNSGEFFHGTLELIEKGVNVLAFQGEDESRPLTDRAVRFLERVTDKLTVIDTRDYALEGISPEFRGILSPMVMYQLCERMSKHLEEVRKHPLELRRYYRRLSY